MLHFLDNTYTAYGKHVQVLVLSVVAQVDKRIGTMTSGNDESNLMKRLATYLPDPVYEELEQWATAEKRSLSNLVSFLLERAIHEKRKESRQADSESKEGREG